MSGSIIVYAGEIENATSIISILNGTSMIHVQNPWFKVAGAPGVDMKSFMTIKKTRGGPMLGSVYLLARASRNGPFQRFNIGWAPAKGTPKQYTVKCPFDWSRDKLESSYRQKLITQPVTQGAEDKNLVVLDQQLSMVMDVMFIAKGLGIDLSTYNDLTDNVAFYTKFCDDINAKLACDTPVVVTNEYIETFNNPPYYAAEGNGARAPTMKLDGRKKSHIKTLGRAFYDVVSEEGCASRLGQYGVCFKETLGALPTFRLIDYVRKSEDGDQTHNALFDTRLTFNIELKPNMSGFNPRIPAGIIATHVVGKGRYEKFNPAILAKLWDGNINSSPQDGSKQANQEGLIILNPTLEYKFFKQGNPTIDWRVVKVACKHIESASMDECDDGDEFAGDDEASDGAADKAVQDDGDAFADTDMDAF